MDIYSRHPTAVPHKPHPTQAIVCAATLGRSQCDDPPRTNSNNEHGIRLNKSAHPRLEGIGDFLSRKGGKMEFAASGPRGPFAEHHGTEPAGMDLSF